MPKAKTKDLTVVDTDPRAAMLHMRAVVKTVVKGGGRADLIPANAEDKDRIIIALQDQLDDATTRHVRATKHIADTVNAMDLAAQVITESTNQMMENLQRAQQAEYELNIAQERIESLQDDVYEMGLEREAALTTLKTVMTNG